MHQNFQLLFRSSLQTQFAKFGQNYSIAVHLYSQLKMDVGHPKHVLQTQNCVFLPQSYSRKIFVQFAITLAIGVSVLTLKLSGRLGLEDICPISKYATEMLQQQPLYLVSC